MREKSSIKRFMSAKDKHSAGAFARRARHRRRSLSWQTDQKAPGAAGSVAFGRGSFLMARAKCDRGRGARPCGLRAAMLRLDGSTARRSSPKSELAEVRFALDAPSYNNREVRGHRLHAKQSGSMAARSPQYYTCAFSYCRSNLARQNQNAPDSALVFG